MNFPILTPAGRRAAGLVTFAIVALAPIVLGVALFGEVLARKHDIACANIQPDLNVMDICERSRNCTYTYKDLEKLVHGYAECMTRQQAHE